MHGRTFITLDRMFSIDSVPDMATVSNIFVSKVTKTTDAYSLATPRNTYDVVNSINGMAIAIE